MVSSFLIGIKEFLVVRLDWLVSVSHSVMPFQFAKIQNKNAVCKFFLKIGTTKLFFNTFRGVDFEKWTK
jgi:hypothetical protein